MSRYSPFYLGIVLGASLAIGSHLKERSADAVAQQVSTKVTKVAQVGFSAPARPAPATSRRCTQLASTHSRWLNADARARDLESKAQGALALAILSDHDDATHFARAKRFQEDAHRAERSAALALRAFSELHGWDTNPNHRCIF